MEKKSIGRKLAQNGSMRDFMFHMRDSGEIERKATLSSKCFILAMLTFESMSKLFRSASNCIKPYVVYHGANSSNPTSRTQSMTHGKMHRKRRCCAQPFQGAHRDFDFVPMAESAHHGCVSVCVSLSNTAATKRPATEAAITTTTAVAMTA